MIPLFSGLTSSLELGLPEEVCQNVSEIEVRFRDYYPYFLSGEVYDNNSTHFGKVSHNLGGHQNGLVAKIIIESAKSCCANVSVSFASLGDDDASYPIAFIVQSEVLRSSHHHSSVDPKKLIFYFPEFSGKGATQVYEYPRAFLPVLKSPGHAVVMLSSDAKFGLKAIEVLGPSLPLLGLMFIAALVFGVVIWFLVRLLCAACRSVFTAGRDISTHYINHLDMVTTTTTKSWSPMWNSLDLSCLLCAVCKSVFTDCRDISTLYYINHLDMVTPTTTKSWSPMWNSLDLSCLLCAVCKSLFTCCGFFNLSRNAGIMPTSFRVCFSEGVLKDSGGLLSPWQLWGTCYQNRLYCARIWL